MLCKRPTMAFISPLGIFSDFLLPNLSWSFSLNIILKLISKLWSIFVKFIFLFLRYWDSAGLWASSISETLKNWTKFFEDLGYLDKSFHEYGGREDLTCWSLERKFIKIRHNILFTENLFQSFGWRKFFPGKLFWSKTIFRGSQTFCRRLKSLMNSLIKIKIQIIFWKLAIFQCIWKRYRDNNWKEK